MCLRMHLLRRRRRLRRLRRRRRRRRRLRRRRRRLRQKGGAGKVSAYREVDAVAAPNQGRTWSGQMKREKQAIEIGLLAL